MVLFESRKTEKPIKPLRSNTRAPIVYASEGTRRNRLYHGRDTGTTATLVDGSDTDSSKNEAVNTSIFRHRSQSAKCVVYAFLAAGGKPPATNAAIASASGCSPDAVPDRLLSAVFRSKASISLSKSSSIKF